MKHWEFFKNNSWIKAESNGLPENTYLHNLNGPALIEYGRGENEQYDHYFICNYCYTKLNYYFLIRKEMIKSFDEWPLDWHLITIIVLDFGEF